MSILRWLPLLLVAGLIGVFGFALFQERTDEGSMAMVGQPAPEFLLPALDGGVGLTRADLEGRISIVNFWASWCGPCRIEHPLLMQLAEDPRVQVLGVAFRDDPEDARSFLEELGNPFDHLGLDTDGRAGIDWGVTGPPETFVVGPDGTILAKHIGALTPDVLRRTIIPAVNRAEAQVNEE